MAWRVIAKVDEIEINEIKPVVVEGRELVLCHLEDGWYVTCGICTHENRSLAKGWIYHGTLVCPRHCGSFDVKTGQAVAPPCVVPIETYKVQVRDEEVWLDC